MNTKESEQEKYHELAYYTLSHRDPSFIHQHAVDAFTAQNANENSKPIAIMFALIGLYLYVEKNYTGRRIQQIHMKLGAGKNKWPEFQLPSGRGEVNISSVLAAPPGKERDYMIRKWCVSVWESYKDSRGIIEEILRVL